MDVVVVLDPYTGNAQLNGMGVPNAGGITPLRKGFFPLIRFK
jgi:hypothetical protein